MRTTVRCSICPKGCELGPGETGDCFARANIDGKIRCTTYGNPCAMSVDPVEKKPLYHFLPATSTFSVATAGCNLHCIHCQNWHLSQNGIGQSDNNAVYPDDIVALAKQEDCPSIAYTYTEPLVSYEYTYNCCKSASEAQLRNILVTAAFINPVPLRNICRFVDAANVDLKSFSEAFYRDICGGSLKPVLRALEIMKECGVMLEITNLIIPTLNDSEQEIHQLCDWIFKYIGEATPLHFSRFYPNNRVNHLAPTPEQTIRRAREIAHAVGLKYVYVGNMTDGVGESTWCPTCGKLLIERQGYRILQQLIKNGCCPACSTAIPGIWDQGLQ